MKSKLDKFFNENYSNLLEIATTISGPDASDILNETVIEIYSLDEVKLKHLLKTDSLAYYIIRIIKLSYISPTSRYQRKYNRVKSTELPLHLENIPNEEPEWTEYDFILLEQSLNKLPWVNQKIVEFRTQTDKTFKQFSEETFISTSMLFKIWKQSLNKLKEEISENNN